MATVPPDPTAASSEATTVSAPPDTGPKLDSDECRSGLKRRTLSPAASGSARVAQIELSGVDVEVKRGVNVDVVEGHDRLEEGVPSVRERH